MYHDQDYQDDQVLISTHYISQYFTHHFLCENRRDHREDAEPRISEVLPAGSQLWQGGPWIPWSKFLPPKVRLTFVGLLMFDYFDF